MKHRVQIMKAAMALLVALAWTGLEAHAGPYVFTNCDKRRHRHERKRDQ